MMRLEVWPSGRLAGGRAPVEGVWSPWPGAVCALARAFAGAAVPAVVLPDFKRSKAGGLEGAARLEDACCVLNYEVAN